MNEHLFKVIINHVNSKVVAIPNLMQILAYCNDEATFDRCKVAYTAWFSDVVCNPQSLEILMKFQDKASYDLAITMFDMTKATLLISEPDKMLYDDLPSDAIKRVSEYIAKFMENLK